MKKVSSLLLLCLCAFALSVSAAAYTTLPWWYPADPAAFAFFHDETAPRVVDEADLFTPEEEQRLESRLAAIRAELDRDIVVYTDRSSYGEERRIVAADFYDYNGYGCGDEREGICLFICMEEGNRGWFACCTGSDTMARYTEDLANEIDDALYPYMADGEYAAGVAGWIENIRDMYLAEPPALPDWYPADTSAFRRFHNEDAPRVVDEADLLSDSHLAELTAKAEEISAKYGVDVLILTTKGNELVDDLAYHLDYYLYNGYGLGSDYSGIQMTVFPHRSDCLISAYGSVESKLNSANLKRMQDRWEDEDTYYGAMEAWLDQVDHMLKTGRVPRTAASWGLTAVLGALFGSAFGGASLGGAKRKMRAPAQRQSADSYLSNGTRIVPLRDDHIGTTRSRRYDPPKKESSHSSGGSSFSSSYSGSSGASHSGSGRSF